VSDVAPFIGGVPPEGIQVDWLIEYLAGDLDDATRERIDLQRQIVGSPVHKWFEEMQQKLSDPFDIDLLR
jgi:hypothetical protein